MNESIKLDDLENVLSEKHMSQADLARRSGLSAHTIGRAIRNGEKVSQDTAFKIAKALRVKVSNLCEHRVAATRGRIETSRTAPKEATDVDPRRLRDAMVEKGMNPTELAQKSGLSVATVSSAIRGLRQPQHRTVKRMAETLGEDVGGSRSTPATEDSTVVELRLRAGQNTVALYPDETSDDGHAQIEESLTARSASGEVLAGAIEGIKEADGEEESEDEEMWKTLLDLRSHVRQSRKMLSSVMDHVIALEDRIEQLTNSAESGQDAAS